MPAPLKYRLRNAFLRGLAGFFIFFARTFPPAWAFALARLFALLAAAVLAEHVKVARTNVRLTLGIPERSREAKAIVRRSLVNLAYTMVEFMLMGKLPGEGVRQMIIEERGNGIEKLRQLLGAGRGVIGLGMHLGNWELSGAYIALAGLQMFAVGKEQKDDFFTRLAFPWRTRHGIINIPRSRKMNSLIVRALKNNGVLGLIADQNGGTDGIFAPFFGLDASNVAGPAALHLKFRSPLVPIVAWRESPGKLVFEVRDPVDTGDILADAEATVPAMTAEARTQEVIRRVNAAYEALIREHPDQWLWIHKRFKTRPAGMPDLYRTTNEV